MGSACCRSKRESKHDTSQGATSTMPGLTRNNSKILDTTINPWQSRRIGQRKTASEWNEQKEIVDAPSATVTERPKSDSELASILDAFQRNSVFVELPQDVQKTLAECMRMYEMDSYQYVFEEDSRGGNSFVVATGTLEVLVQGERVQILEPGDTFGDSALLHNVPRRRTVRTLEKCALWGLEGKMFRQAVAHFNAANFQENFTFLRSIKMFDVLTDEEVENLLIAIASQIFTRGSEIVTEGESGSILFIIKSGTVSCVSKGVETRKLNKGDYFGEQALLYDTPRTATVSAFTDVRVLSISREALQLALGETLQQVIYRNSIRIAFDGNALLKSLTAEQRERLIDYMEIGSVKAGSILSRDANTNNVIILLKGELIGKASKKYGKFTILDENIREELLASTDCDLASFSLTSAESILGNTIAKVAFENETLSFLRRVSLCRGFSQQRLKQLISVIV